jgi:hypothetical protein
VVVVARLNLHLREEQAAPVSVVQAQTVQTQQQVAL